eukprot:14780750-Ditylum_brightwellii.AAC.1
MMCICCAQRKYIMHTIEQFANASNTLSVHFIQTQLKPLRNCHDALPVKKIHLYFLSKVEGGR